MRDTVRGIERPTPTYGILLILYTTIVIASLVLTKKIIVIDGYYFSGCLLTFPLLYPLGDIIAEIYGYEEAKALIWYTLASGLIFSLAVNFGIKLPSPPALDITKNYEAIFSSDIRFIFSGIIAIGAGGLVNAYLITKWKILTQGKYFWMRGLGASAIGELVNSLIAFPLGFIGIVPLKVILSIITTSYIIKLIYTIFTIYPASFIVAYLKYKKEKNISERFELEKNVLNMTSK